MDDASWIRRIIDPRVREVAAHFPAVLLTGARQTGKTTLLRQCFPDAAFVTLDLPSIAAQAAGSPGLLLDNAADQLILDEVQYAPEIFRHLKVRIDQAPRRVGRFLMTGSQKFALMQSVSESLAGRCAIIELETLSAGEVRGTFGSAAPSVTEFLFRGGFPVLYRDRTQSASDFHRSYVVTYLERDVRSLLHVGDLRDFERFVRACAARSGALLNLTDLARDVSISASTARQWLSVLEASNQIVLLEPFFGNKTKRLVKSPKLYFRDTGTLCFLLGIDTPEAMVGSPFIGAIWETYVLGELRRAVAAAGSAAQLFFFRDAHGTEVDFAVEHNGRVRLIEAKWTEVPDERRMLSNVAKVAEWLGKRAAAEHWLVCRTPHPYAVEAPVHACVVNGYEFTDWLGS
jgi:predicted AAA+ superfamily ATPase